MQVRLSIFPWQQSIEGLIHRPYVGLFRVVAPVALAFVAANAAHCQVTWTVDNTATIGGNSVVAVVGNPIAVSTPFGKGMKFDGNDGLIVDSNPIAGAANFTIEVLIRPDLIRNDSSNEPRVLHLQSEIPPDHRATLEARVIGDSWYPDVFLRSKVPGQSDPSWVDNLTLIDESKLHPLNKWYNFAITYDGAQFRSYLNGQLVLSGALAVGAMTNGQTSIGMRHNRVNFFQGVIARIRFTRSAVIPADFMQSKPPVELAVHRSRATGRLLKSFRLKRLLCRSIRPRG